MDWPGPSLPLARSDGLNVVQLVFMVFVGVIWAVGALLTRLQQEKARQKAQQPRLPHDDPDDEAGWQIIAPPSPPAEPAKAPHPAKPAGGHRANHKNSRAHLAHMEHVHHLEHTPLPVVHAEDQLPTHHHGKPESAAGPRAATNRARRQARAGLARLSEAKLAREAMIFHEIFSPPKALRDQPGLWE